MVEEMSRIEVLGALTAESQTGKISLKADGESCQLSCNNFPKSALLSNVLLFVEAGNRRSLKKCHSAFAASGLSVDVMVRGVLVAKMGREARPGALSRLLGMGSIELRLIPFLTSMLKT